MERAEKKAERFIPINKGNYNLETPEREELFDRLRGEGWEQEYLQYRADWSAFPANRFVSDYPLLVDLELSSLCNLRCPMCYTITPEFRERVGPGLMDLSLFGRIVEEIGGKTPALRLSLRGEPTIHPGLLEAISIAKSRGIREVSLLTNGSRLNRDFFIGMMEAGIDWITISVDGTGETYERIRRPLKFSETLHKIKEIKAIKDERGIHRPVVKIQAVWPAIKEDPQNFYNTFAPYVDLIAFNPLIDYLGNDSDIVYEENFSCPQLYQRLVVGFDGRALMCSNDEEGSITLGDANRQSIHEIWHGAEISRIRDIHEKGMFRINPTCRKCYLPRSTEDGETAVVNGRRFHIRNYINRKQGIGE
jgi:radical SAM protein with 4Fe4S-binding SPASM domain